MKRTSTEWCDYTWNPVTGCRNRCGYCKARRISASFSGDVRRNRMAGRDMCENGNYVLETEFSDPEHGYVPYPFGYEPTLHKYRLEHGKGPGKLKTGYNIYAGSMGELFGDWVPDSWLEQIFSVTRTYQQHNYLFMTSNPGRYEELKERGILNTSGNCWYGTTITGGPVLRSRLLGIVPVFLNFEPLCTKPEFVDKDKRAADWIILGGLKNSRDQNRRVRESWISSILDYADYHDIPVFINNNLCAAAGRENMRKEYPCQIRDKNKQQYMSDKMAADCVKCKERKRKDEMIALLTRSVRGEAPRQTAYACRTCMQELCLEWGVKQPELEVYR